MGYFCYCSYYFITPLLLLTPSLLWLYYYPSGGLKYLRDVCLDLFLHTNTNECRHCYQPTKMWVFFLLFLTLIVAYCSLRLFNIGENWFWNPRCWFWAERAALCAARILVFGRHFVYFGIRNLPLVISQPRASSFIEELHPREGHFTRTVLVVPPSLCSRHQNSDRKKILEYISHAFAIAITSHLYGPSSTTESKIYPQKPTFW